MKPRTLLVTMCLTTLSLISAPVFAEDDKEDKSGKVEWEGKIEAMPESGMQGAWTVAGRTVHVNHQTRFDDEKGKKMAMGEFVEVNAHKVNDNLIAAEIEFEDDKELDKKDD
jgi:hypothetical protein